LAGKSIALAVIDHIVSTTAIVVPVKRVIEVLRKVHAFASADGQSTIFMIAIFSHCSVFQHGVERVLVDGAHAPGSISLHIPSLGADYYVGNIHKCTLSHCFRANHSTHFCLRLAHRDVCARLLRAAVRGLYRRPAEHASAHSEPQLGTGVQLSADIILVFTPERLKHLHGLVGECSMLGTKDYASHCVVYDAVL
jgi:hypothetical protein